MDKTSCQVHHKPNDTTIKCFYRFGKSYSRENHSIVGDKQGTHNAFLASQTSVQDYDWYFDNGATNHVTNQTSKFQNLIEHHGKNSLVVGNGEKLKILGTGFTKLNSLKLHDVLYVPNITKNSLCVTRLASENNILVEFDKKRCFVKDKMTGRAILRGELKDDLYQLSGNEKGPNCL